MKKPKNKLTYLLFAAVIFIWGTVANSIINYFSASGESEKELLINDEAGNQIAASSFEHRSEKEIEYSDLERDPFVLAFRPARENKNPKSVVKKQTVPQKEKFAYKIHGVIVNGKSKMVLLEDITEKTTQFLREGETYKNLKIKKITNAQVILTEDNETKTIMVQ